VAVGVNGVPVLRAPGTNLCAGLAPLDSSLAILELGSVSSSGIGTNVASTWPGVARGSAGALADDCLEFTISGAASPLFWT